MEWHQMITKSTECLRTLWFLLHPWTIMHTKISHLWEIHKYIWIHTKLLYNKTRINKANGSGCFSSVKGWTWWMVSVQFCQEHPGIAGRVYSKSSGIPKRTWGICIVPINQAQLDTGNKNFKTSAFAPTPQWWISSGAMWYIWLESFERSCQM